MSSISVAIPKIDQPQSAPETGPRVAMYTMGCKVNSFESELIAENLARKSYTRVNWQDQADVYIVNTCTVTSEADRQARQQIRRLARSNPEAKIVVTGCYAQMDPAACEAIPGVDLVVGNGEKLNIPEILQSFDLNQTETALVTDLDEYVSLPQDLLSGFEGKTRAFVQVQQGCDQGCTFCIIHRARGPNRSFDANDVLRQVQNLESNGYREIVLCGVDIGSYGMDQENGKSGLLNLLKMLCQDAGDVRFRLSSIDPAHITDELIELMATDKHLCPQLHLSLQSGNTLILKRMKRRATREVLYDRIGELRKAVPELVLSADILVGFPTEEEDHFQETLAAIDELEISFPHVFAYSERQGTPAARIPRKVPVPVRKQRAKLAREMGKKVWTRVAGELMGQNLRVLVESTQRDTDSHGAQLRGRADNYFPVDILVEPNKTGQIPLAPGDWATVQIEGISENSLIARAID